MFTEVIHKKDNIYKVKNINKDKEFYIVTDGKYHAHGDSLKQAKEDLEFKIVSEKLKKEPIKKDTVLTIKYYRLLTGACAVGVQDWMEKHKVEEGITAEKLLPLLEKSNAYGLNTFKKLITF